MSVQPPAPPQPPQKPIQSRKWLLLGALGLIAVFVLVDMLASIHWMSASARRSQQQQHLADRSVPQNFNQEEQNQLNHLKKERENAQAIIEKLGKLHLGDLMKLPPDCNQDERNKLNGQYFVTATADGTPVRLACMADDQWAVIPTAAASIEPPTPQQENAMARYGQQPNDQQSTAQQLAQQRREEAQKKRQEALYSSSVVLDVSVKKTAESLPQPVLPQATTQNAASNESEKQVVQASKPKYPWDNYSGQLYRVFEGDVIETVLTNRLNGEFTGPVNVMVETNIYSHDRQHILIPQGTRVLGTAEKVTVNEQRRLAVVFHRAIMPDGWSVDLDRFAGLDQQGASGLTGKVNTHWGKIIGTAILVGAIGGLSEGFGATGGVTGPAIITTGIGQSTGQQATQILNRALNVLPTVTVFEGTRVRIWTAQDFELPAYENHLVSPTL